MSKLRWKIAQYAEIRWWQNYLQRKPVADYLQWKTAYWKDFLRQAELSPEPGSQVLDAGCGPAGIFTILEGLQVDAVDPLIDRYEDSLIHFKKSQYSFVSFFPVSIEEIMPVKSYDIIFCLNAINHFENLNACLEKLVNCLRPGGTMVISIDAHNYQIFKYLFRLIPGDILHPHQYDLDEYRHMLVSRGLKVVKEIRFQQHFLFNYYAIVCHKA